MKGNLQISTDVERISQNFYTAPCNGVVTHEAPIEGIRVFADHTRANKQNKMCPLSLHAAVHMHLGNHGYFDRGKKA